jgi:hypothetical protein
MFPGPVGTLTIAPLPGRIKIRMAASSPVPEHDWMSVHTLYGKKYAGAVEMANEFVKARTMQRKVGAKNDLQ